MVSSFLQHVVVESSDNYSGSDVDDAFLYRSSLKVGSSFIFDNSRYLFGPGRYDIQSKDAPVDHIPIWQKIVAGITYNAAEFYSFSTFPVTCFWSLLIW